MRIEYDNDDIKIFLHNCYLKDINWHDKIDIEDCIKNILHKICKNYKLKLCGFYKIKIYPHKIGTFIEIIKIDDDSYDGEEVDFRIMVIFNKKMYLKMPDYDYIEKYDTFFLEDNYYIDLDEIDNSLAIIDLGDIVFDDNIDFNKIIFLKKNKT